MHLSRIILVFGLVITAFVGGTLFMTLAFQGPRDLPQHATILPQAGALPQFSLLDQNGAEFNNESLVVSGACCSLVSLTVRTYARRRCSNWRLHAAAFLQEGAADFPSIVLISVAPERDTPDVMAEYVAHFGDGVTGVTGSLTELRTLTAALGIFFEKSDGAKRRLHGRTFRRCDRNQ